jgi:hypothetical protein
MNKFVVGKLMGRCGNQFYQIATTFAYAKKHNLDFFVTSDAPNCDNNAYYFNQFPKRDSWFSNFEEPRNENGNSYYFDLPRLDNICLIGYWQSFKYFDDYREEILQAFNLPYEFKEGYVSLHIRRGDYLQLSEKLSLMSMEYYKKALAIFPNHKVLVFSDDINWCKENLNELSDSLEFSEGKSEIEDLILMANCEHNILANSTFSYAASWFNRNKEKIVVTPKLENMFGGCNLDMIPDNYIKIEQ